MVCLLVVAVFVMCVCVWFVCVFVCFGCDVLSVVVWFGLHGVVVFVCVCFSCLRCVCVFRL